MTQAIAPKTLPDPAHIASLIASGELVILPTETVYGVFASARHAGALAALARLRTSELRGPMTWHVPDSATLIRRLGIQDPTHRWIISRLTPGPVRFLVERSPVEAAQVLDALEVEDGIVSQGSVYAVRVPDHTYTRTVLELTPSPVVGERLQGPWWGAGDGRQIPADLYSRAQAHGIRAIIDDGPTPYGIPSTTIRLTLQGGYGVESALAVSEAEVRARVERLILFVCTGNTCRSPMAQALAQDEIESTRSPIPTRVASAGIAATNGTHMTPESRTALSELGVDPGAFRSQLLTRELVARAHAIFAMTPSHARRVVELDPNASRKTHLLDPSGADIPDPIGGEIDDYRACARRISTLVRSRIRELDKHALVSLVTSE